MWPSVCPLTKPHSAGLRPLLYYTLVGRILGENWKNTLAWPWGQRMDFLRITLPCFFYFTSIMEIKQKSNAMWLCVADLSTRKSQYVAFSSYFHNGSKILKKQRNDEVGVRQWQSGGNRGVQKLMEIIILNCSKQKIHNVYKCLHQLLSYFAIDGSNFLMAQTAGVYRSTGIWFVNLTLINTINNYPLQ